MSPTKSTCRWRQVGSNSQNSSIVIQSYHNYVRRSNVPFRIRGVNLVYLCSKLMTELFLPICLKLYGDRALQSIVLYLADRWGNDIIQEPLETIIVCGGSSQIVWTEAAVEYPLRWTPLLHSEQRSRLGKLVRACWPACGSIGTASCRNILSLRREMHLCRYSVVFAPSCVCVTVCDAKRFTICWKLEGSRKDLRV